METINLGSTLNKLFGASLRAICGPVCSDFAVPQSVRFLGAR